MNGRWVRSAVRLAVREGRHSFRRVGPYMVSITLGVASLVAIHSFRADVERSLEEQSEVLMGANARLRGDRPWSDTVRAIVDSLEASDRSVARVTTTSSMVMAPTSGIVRLMQVRALDPGYPFYGTVRTVPDGRWGAHLEAGRVLVDPAVLVQLQAAVGDTIEVGRERLEIAGTVDDLPTDLGFQTALGPRIHLSHGTLEEADLLGFGSLARYELYFELPERSERSAFDDRYDEVFSQGRLRFTLAEQQARSLSNGVRFLARFLGLVGLGALLLGGIGVASAIHVYVREKRASIAVMRCLGATQRTTFLVYLLQAGALGAFGAGAGVAVGVGIQLLLPGLLAGVLPVPVSPRISSVSAVAGLGIGMWVALVFALLPLLSVRDVTPLQALRADVESRRGSRVWRGIVYLALAASITALCVLEAPDREVGIAFAFGLAAVVTALWATARVLTFLTRRFVPSRAPYPVRQGISNLFRPRNQTVSVMLALGVGTFVIGLLLEVEGTVRRDLSVSLQDGRPNLLLFDIQRDQTEDIRALLPEPARGEADVFPLVSSRIAAINGRTPEELRDDTVPSERRPEGWALRREYRNTYRAELGRAEELISGRWWDGTAGSDDGTRVDPGDLSRLSLEEDIAESLRVRLGDTITWNVSGVEVPSVVSSVRRVDWDRLEPNFFAVLEPGSLDEAPQTALMLVRIPDEGQRLEVQQALVRTFPNVSALDISRVQEAVESVLGSVRRGLGFLGAFAAAAGAVVLVGAMATSRFQRIREGALLRTLGARRAQVILVLFTEYAALGTLATFSGLLLAVGAAALLLPGVFDMPYRPDLGTLALVWGSVSLLTVLVGLSGSRSLLSRPPLPVLREAED
ncbi:MAG: FtsX-like permease family protein [Gemmatimonadota bacterium]|nr:FtsX-like permease family protein [Gemmatimonadota bacterium]